MSDYYITYGSVQKATYYLSKTADRWIWSDDRGLLLRYINSAVEGTRFWRGSARGLFISFGSEEEALEWARPICELGVLVSDYYLGDEEDWDDHR